FWRQADESRLPRLSGYETACGGVAPNSAVVNARHAHLCVIDRLKTLLLPRLSLICPGEEPGNWRPADRSPDGHPRQIILSSAPPTVDSAGRKPPARCRSRCPEIGS